MFPVADSPPRRGWRRLGVSSLLSILVATLGLVWAPTPAHAIPSGPEVPCPTNPGLVWQKKIYSKAGIYEFTEVLTVQAATRVFIPSDERLVVNALSSPISATFTSSHTRRHSVSVTIGSTTQFVKELQTTVSTQIVQERVTAIGVSAVVTVPANTRVLGQYGVDVYNVTYLGQQIWRKYKKTNRCWEVLRLTGTTVAPTITEGWRFTSAGA